jgi:8-oxo-dGTP pyrophosphatase MutT (NUDIX family)
MKSEWIKLDSRRIYQNRIVGLREDTYHFIPNDIRKDFTVFEFSDWVNVIPLTANGDIVMIKQFRHGTDSVTLEIPGGLIEKEDIDPSVAALREMEEETGYFSEHMIHIGTVEPNPAIQTNRCHTFLAKDAYLKSPQNFDPTESITLELIKAEKVLEMIKAGDITHGLVVAAFAFYMLRQE